MRIFRPLRQMAAAVLIASASGCANFGYYLQSVGGQMNVVEARQPIANVISNPQTPPELKRQLELALEIRNFASRELAEPDNESFRSYADLKRPYALWNVFAAPEFSLEPHRWCFLLAGCVGYRGYFSHDEAANFADGLRAEGYDVYVAGVPTYSTLGWFDDPLLNTFIDYPEPDLARIIFHELAHQIVYVKDDTTFNESFAVAVELEGVRRWLAQRGDPALKAEFERSQRRRAQFQALIAEYRARLDGLYRQPIAPEAMRARKADLFAAMKQDYSRLKAEWGGFAGYDRLFETPNNALLAAVALYTERVPQFQQLIEKHHSDLAAFYAEVTEIARLDKEERERALRTPR
ncbi:MAG TPA: aminopeptidase [Burkholderiales bacterium]|nr:aminopeptidase [Burkholderiales bacterium]